MATITKTEVIKTTFQLKRGQSAVWVEKNPVLAPGEPGFELDTHKLKIGDGKTAWNDLPYTNTDNSASIEVNFASKEQIEGLFKEE